MEHLDGYGAFDAPRGRFEERLKFLPAGNRSHPPFPAPFHSCFSILFDRFRMVFLPFSGGLRGDGTTDAGVDLLVRAPLGNALGAQEPAYLAPAAGADLGFDQGIERFLHVFLHFSTVSSLSSC